jgi:26S proteasome regulatory subunit N10
LPYASNQDKLVKIAKKLKKNNVAVDIVSFGCDAENEEKLEAFHAAVNSNNNSNLVIVPPGPVLSDVLIGSAIFQGENGNAFGGGGGAGAGGDGYEFGMDPNMDPELALALRVSLEEERARQDAARVAAGGDAAPADAPAAEGTSAAGAASSVPTPAAAPASRPNDADMDEDALLQQALAMSMQVDDTFPQSTPAAAAPADAAMADAADDEELQLALQLSMADAEVTAVLSFAALLCDTNLSCFFQGDAADDADKEKK